MKNTKDYSLTETAKEVRKTLKRAFPATKFSVRSKSYSGGCSISVRWMDGPASSQVNPILGCFENASFDGMIDLKSYNTHPYEYKGEPVRFQADYVQGQRSVSFEFMAVVAFQVCKRLGISTPEVIRSDYDGSGYIKDGAVVNYNLYKPSQDKPHTLTENLDNICSDETRPGMLAQLIHDAAHFSSLEAERDVDLPKYPTESYIDETVRSLMDDAS